MLKKLIISFILLISQNISATYLDDYKQAMNQLDALLKSKYPTFSRLNINKTDVLGRTILIVAVLNNDKEIVQLLLKCGNIDIDAPNAQNSSALLLAIEKGYHEIIEMILNSQQMESGIGSTTLSRKEEALTYAAKHSDEKTFAIIFRHCAEDVTERCYFKSLKAAIARDSKEIIALLIGENSQHIFLPEMRKTILRKSLRIAVKYGNSEIVKLLIKAGAQDDKFKDRKHDFPESALMLAAEKNSEEIVHLLIPHASVKNIKFVYLVCLIQSKYNIAKILNPIALPSLAEELVELEEGINFMSFFNR